jgi:phosphatidylserine/phosphatidylglycerophosphate/cardiolipin synthase-like enzyme
MARFFLALIFCAFGLSAQDPILGAAIRVYFSPDGKPTEAIVAALNRAKTAIRVQAYSFTSAPIADALKKAHQRGVDVQVILDKSQPNQSYNYASFFLNAKIPVSIDSKHAIAHNKIIIIDGTTVITGSFNFTKSAEERNAENLLIIESPELARIYLDNWDKHKKHSEQVIK